MAVAAVSVLGAVGLSACSGGALSNGPSDGWKQFEGERVTVEYPQDWTKQEGSGDKWVFAVEGENATMQVADPYNNSRFAADAIGVLQFQSTLGLDGFEPGNVREITVDGADTALVQTFTYTDGGETADGAWIIAGQRQPGATIAVTIAGTGVDDALISHVADTLTYEFSDEPVPDESGQS